MKEDIKIWVGEHPRLLKIAQGMLRTFRPTPKLIGLDYGIFLAERLARDLPSDIDCVIGVPRSGLLFANVIANMRGWPLSTPECFVQHIVWQCARKPLPTAFHKVLVLEDTIGAGTEMNAAVKTLKDYDPNLQISRVSIFATHHGAGKVERHQAIVHTFDFLTYEWCAAHVGLNGWETCVDLDGVLCKDGSAIETYLIPTFTLDAIITSRPESERESTEAWLRKSGIMYKFLLMKEDGISSVDHKVRALKVLKPWWFWESNRDEAMMIAKKAHIPVLCIEDMRVYQ